jgi:hypothetical protein
MAALGSRRNCSGRAIGAHGIIAKRRIKRGLAHLDARRGLANRETLGDRRLGPAEFLVGDHRLLATAATAGDSGVKASAGPFRMRWHSNCPRAPKM